MATGNWAAGQRLRKSGASRSVAIIRRIHCLAFERNIPAPEVRVAVAGVKRAPTAALIDFADRHGINFDWLLTGNLSGLHKMAKPQPLPTPAEIGAALAKCSPSDREKLCRKIRSLATAEE